LNGLFFVDLHQNRGSEAEYKITQTPEGAFEKLNNDYGKRLRLL
jgi:hypothetical protein